MARLKVKLHGKTLSDIPLSEGQSYVAGRKDTCDIHLQGGNGISREHFRLSPNNGSWSLEALARFGEVLVDGERVANITLGHGAMISVPPYEFEFLMTSADQAVPENLPSEIAVSAEGAESAATEEDANAEPLGMEKTHVGVAPSVPYIKMLDRAGDVKELIRLDAGDSWLAGRESSCHIYIRDQRVSRRQFEVRRNGGQFSIIDLGSVNGTLVNSQPISSQDPTPLKSGDAITVLENYLYFELHDPNFKSRLEMVNLHPPAEGGGSYLGDPNFPAEAGPFAFPAAYDQAPAPVDYQPMDHEAIALQSVPTVELGGGANARTKKIRLILAVLAIIAILWSVMGKKESPAAPMANPADPLARMSEDEKKLVRDTLQLAKSYYLQGKYDFAKSELFKLSALIPEYEDSRELTKLTEDALYIQQQKRKQEQQEKDQKDAEEKIQARAALCRQQMTPDTTRAAMETCLLPVLPLNPSHPLFEELFAAAEHYQNDKAAQRAMDAAYQNQVARLRNMHAGAKSLDTAGKPLSAMQAYERVTNSKLPDPDGLKPSSQARIAELKEVINARTGDLQKEADKAAHEGRLKDAIVSLRQAKSVDPQNAMIDDKIDAYRQRLQEDMLRLYQEGVLDESFGNVDGDDAHQGAKQKWKEILKKDVEDGDYYKKAYIKLKKYGSSK